MNKQLLTKMINEYRMCPEKILNSKEMKSLIKDSIRTINDEIPQKPPGHVTVMVIIEKLAFLTQELKKTTIKNKPSNKLIEALADAHLGLDYLSILYDFTIKESFDAKFIGDDAIINMMRLIQILTKSLYEKTDEKSITRIASECMTSIQMLEKLYTDSKTVQIIKTIKIMKHTIKPRIKTAMSDLLQRDTIMDFKIMYEDTSEILEHTLSSKAYIRSYDIAMTRGCNVECYIYHKDRNTTAVKPVFEVIYGETFISGTKI